MARKRKKRTSGKKSGSRWIQKAIKRPGQLHRDLGIPEGKKIPLSVLRKAAKRKDKVGQRARLALNLRKLAGKGKSKKGKSKRRRRK